MKRPLSSRVFLTLLAAVLVAGGFALASLAATREPPTTHVSVHVTEWEFSSVSPESAPTGTVVFTIFNDGVFPHDFAINGRASPVVPSGKAATLTVEFTRPGVFSYGSTVDDWDREMWGSFTVTGEPITMTTGRLPESRLPLRKVRDVPLPGSASRFDYQSVDVKRRRLFIAHLGAGRVLSFDLARQRVAGVIDGVPDVRGVLAVPPLRRLYAAATGAHQLVTFDERTLRRVGSAPAGDFPDGVAYDAREKLVFVSDVSGEQLTIFRAVSGKRVDAVALGGSPGNVQYDERAHQVVVAVGSRNEVAVIAPERRRIVRRVRLTQCDDPHGVEVVSAARRAYIACEQSATLVVLDLRTMRQRGSFSVGQGPDVLDYDPGLKRLYVASESGTVSVFGVSARGVRKLGQAKLDPHAHSVAVDAKTHRVYFPLEDVGGRPVLRVMQAT